MAQLNYQADPEMKPSYGLIEPGDYLAMIIASEMKPNKARTGEYLQLTVEVIDGQYKGRKVFDRLNIRNQNKTAERMAIESLNALCLATNTLHLNDSEQLHNIPVMITVDIEEGKDGYDDQNRIKGYTAAGGSPAHGQAMAAAAQERAPAPAASNTPVWKKRAA